MGQLYILGHSLLPNPVSFFKVVTCILPRNAKTLPRTSVRHHTVLETKTVRIATPPPSLMNSKHAAVQHRRASVETRGRRERTRRPESLPRHEFKKGRERWLGPCGAQATRGQSQESKQSTAEIVNQARGGHHPMVHARRSVLDGDEDKPTQGQPRKR